MQDRQISHYKIIDKIGGGGMGVVYKAVDTKLGRTVALKFLPPGFTRDETARKRFIHEAQAASLLDHPNICSIYEIDESPEGQVFISMAYCEGTSLRDRIKDGPLPVREVFELVFSVADGLSSAHQRGIVHRDVKPGNIIITTEGFVKLIDFGLAKLADRSRVTRTGHAPGTLSYMSPEQVSGKDIDGRTDLWALGVVAYEALSGKLPFEADIDPAMMYQIMNEDPPPLRTRRAEVPEEFEAIIHKCLAKDPAARYATAADLIRDLVEMGRKLGWQSSGTYRTVMRVGSAAASRRRRLLLPIVVLLAGIASAAGYFVMRGSSTAPELFSTEVRVAVLPLKNLAGESAPPEFSNGLSEWVADALERAGAVHRSMWVVPFAFTQQGAVATPSHAKDAFGVNRLVTGTIQRYGEGFRVALELLDAESLRRIRTANVDYGADLTVLERGIVNQSAALMGVTLSGDARKRIEADFTGQSAAFEGYLRGLGHLQAYRHLGHIDRAVEALRRAVELDSLFACAHAALALAYSKRCVAEKRPGPCEEAAVACAAALRIDSTSVYVNDIVGAVQTDLKNYTESIRAYRRILALEQKNAWAFQQMGDAFNRLDRVAEAEAAYRAGATAEPDSWQSHARLGWFLDHRGKADEAIEHYERALALAPNDPWTLNTLGNVSLDKDEWPKARDYFLRSFAVDPRCLPCRNIGLLYYLEGLYSDSAKYFKFALEYCDSTAADHYQRWQDFGAALYWAEGRRGEAVSAFRRAIALGEKQLSNGPEDAELLAYLAGCHAMVEDRARALSLLDRVSALESSSPDVLFIIGQTYEKLGDRERALRYIADAVRLEYRMSWILAEPVLEELTQDSRFQQLVDAAGKKSETGQSKVQ